METSPVPYTVLIFNSIASIVYILDVVYPCFVQSGADEGMERLTPRIYKSCMPYFTIIRSNALSATHNYIIQST